jgi:hypothetical protein
VEDIAARLAARVALNGERDIQTLPAARAPCPACSDRRERSLHHCHMPAETKLRHPVPRETGAYVPEMAARIENDRNLTDGARRCARKLMEYFYRRNRAGRAGDITVTWLMRALGKSRRSVQRYLEQLEREGYIAIEVVYARTRMCVGLFIELLAPLFPRHHRQKWPQKLIGSDAPQMSQNNRPRYKYSRKSWALRCMDGVFRSLMKSLSPPPSLLSSV